MPTLFIVGGREQQTIDVHQRAIESMHNDTRLEIVLDATSQFEEAGALPHVAQLAADWFNQHLTAESTESHLSDVESQAEKSGFSFGPTVPGRYAPHQISSWMPISTTRSAGIWKKFVARRALCERKIKSLSRHTDMPRRSLASSVRCAR